MANKNYYIETWRLVIESLVKTAKLMHEDTDEKQLIRQLADEQKIRLENERADQTKSIYEQVEGEKKEYLEWLDKVIETGDLNYDRRTSN